MLTAADIITKLSPYKTELFQKYHLKEMGIFGSASRGDNNDESDVDILVDYDGILGLEFVDLAEELESILKTKVDLISRKALKPLILTRIKKELVYV